MAVSQFSAKWTHILRGFPGWFLPDGETVSFLEAAALFSKVELEQSHDKDVMWSGSGVRG